MENQDLLIPKVIEFIKGKQTIAKTAIMHEFMIGFNRSERLLKELGQLGYIDYKEGYQTHFILKKEVL